MHRNCGVYEVKLFQKSIIGDYLVDILGKEEMLYIESHVMVSTSSLDLTWSSSFQLDDLLSLFILLPYIDVGNLLRVRTLSS